MPPVRLERASPAGSAGTAIIRRMHPPTARRRATGSTAAQPEASGGQPGAPGATPAQLGDAAGTPGGRGAGETAPERQGSSGTAAGRRWPAEALAVLRRHWLVSVLLAAGLVLRVLAQVAYQPALIYVDTLKYLYGASPGSEPLGYHGVLAFILLAGDLSTVTAIQHLLGLGMAVTLYVVLVRRGVYRWLAALAVAPVLLDAYQLQIEQMIMPDVWFEAIIVAGLAVLLWRTAVTVLFAIAGGAILGAAATVMQLGVVLILPAVIYVLAAARGWRQALSKSAAVTAAFLVVILGYCSYSYVHTGHFWLARRQSLTGRLAAAADCATLKLPANVRPLCPGPAAQAMGPDWLEHSGQSPLYADGRGHLIPQFDSAVLSQQPLRVLGSIVGDSLRLFALTRDPVQSVTPISRWQFQAGYPTYPPWVNVCPAGRMSADGCLLQQHAIQKKVAPDSDLLVRPGGTIVVGVQTHAFGLFHASRLRVSYGRDAQVNRPIAGFLRAYQLDGGYTPGPLLALAVLAGLAGGLLLLSRRLDDRTHQLGLGSLLFTGAAVVVLLAPDVYEFSWRYQIPAAVTLVPAGVLGVATVASWLAARRRSRTERGGQISPA
jgi:hypothetical protein